MEKTQHGKGATLNKCNIKFDGSGRKSNVQKLSHEMGLLEKDTDLEISHRDRV